MVHLHCGMGVCCSRCHTQRHRSQEIFHLFYDLLPRYGLVCHHQSARCCHCHDLAWIRLHPWRWRGLHNRSCAIPHREEKTVPAFRIPCIRAVGRYHSVCGNLSLSVAINCKTIYTPSIQGNQASTVTTQRTFLNEGVCLNCRSTSANCRFRTVSEWSRDILIQKSCK